MNISILKRTAEVENSAPIFQVWAGKTAEEARQKAVNAIMREWYYAFTPKDEDEDEVSADEIFEAYIDFWAGEELFELEEQTV